MYIYQNNNKNINLKLILKNKKILKNTVKPHSQILRNCTMVNAIRQLAVQ